MSPHVPDEDPTIIFTAAPRVYAALLLTVFLLCGGLYLIIAFGVAPLFAPASAPTTPAHPAQVVCVANGQVVVDETFAHVTVDGQRITGWKAWPDNPEAAQVFDPPNSLFQCWAFPLERDQR